MLDSCAWRWPLLSGFDAGLRTLSMVDFHFCGQWLVVVNNPLQQFTLVNGLFLCSVTPCVGQWPLTLVDDPSHWLMVVSGPSICWSWLEYFVCRCWVMMLVDGPVCGWWSWLWQMVLSVVDSPVCGWCCELFLWSMAHRIGQRWMMAPSGVGIPFLWSVLINEPFGWPLMISNPLRCMLISGLFRRMIIPCRWPHVLADAA